MLSNAVTWTFLRDCSWTEHYNTFKKAQVTALDSMLDKNIRRKHTTTRSQMCVWAVIYLQRLIYIGHELHAKL